MKRVGRVLLAVTVCSSLLSGPLFAQSITAQVKQAPSIDKATREAIDLAVSQHIQKLADQNPDAQRQAREAIVGELRLPGGEPSAAFTAAYSESLGNAVMKLPKNVDVRGLLNAAIAVARVAEVTKSTRLENVVVWLLSPEQPEAIKLWGMKAARAIAPAVAKIPNNKLLALIVPTVKAHPSGAMTAEAYEALLDPAATNQLLDLVALRASLYQGPAAPEDPHVDYIPFASFLSVKQWGALTPQQKLKVAQLICNLMTLGARHGDAAAGNLLLQEQLTNLFQQMAKALEAIALQLGQQELKNVAANASRAAPPVMEQAAKPICATIKKIKGFESVQEPSMGGGGAAGEAPVGK
jgi:hypothetical protein